MYHHLLLVLTAGAIFATPQNGYFSSNITSFERLRIIGGQEAQPYQYPYHVGLQITAQLSTYFCSGSLISPNYVLTTTSCLLKGISAVVILGAHDITKAEPTQLKLNSDELIMHDDYDSSFFLNDIGLIKLPRAVTENDYIKIVKLATGGDSYSNKKGVVTGWGVTSNNGQNITPVLRYLNSKILSNQDCAKIDPYGSVLQRSHLCLSGSGTVGVCNGDAGGPLVVDGVQVGVVSFYYNDCEVGKPSVFTRLTEFTDWIRAHSDAL